MEASQRTIPAAIKRQVRQECFFGCVICGAVPFEYDHFGDEFKDAEEHDAAKIALLCPLHHREKTARRLPTRVVAAARAKPHNRARSVVYRPLLGPGVFTAEFGGIRAKGEHSATVRCNGALIFGAGRGEDGGWLFNADLRDAAGRRRLVIVDNEIVVGSDVWDIRLEGRSLTISASDRELFAKIMLDPEQRVVSVTRLRMELGGGFQVECRDKTTVIKQRGEVVFTFKEVEVDDCLGDGVAIHFGTFPRWEGSGPGAMG